MPSKSSPSKPRKTSDDKVVEEPASVESAKPHKAEKDKVLSLIEDKKPRIRAPRKDGGGLPPLGATKAPQEPKKEEAPAGPAKPTLDERKAAALNLFEDDDKPKVRRRPADAGQNALPPISLLAEDNTPKPIVPIVHAPPAEVPVPEFEVGESGEKIIHLKPPIVVKDLADKMGLKPFKIISDLIAFKVFASADKAIENKIAEKICEKHGFKLELEKRKAPPPPEPDEPIVEPNKLPAPGPDEIDTRELRAPIITFMGHVDHGKTSLLDALRKTQVTAGEAGGITQHIGAYCIFHGGKPITFIDTPGHAAFSAMRARGASLTDIAVIIIAADDGVMPQTKEAIKHAKQAGVQILVAINKCDLPQAKPELIRQQLSGEGLTPEEWGGDIVCCEVSAMTGKGLDHLLEMILIQADVLELTASLSRRADGYVIEAQLEQGRGPTASVLVSGGILHVGDVILCGEHFGRIRGLIDDRGRKVKEASPGTAARIMGLSGVPEAGAHFRVMLNEKRARELAEKESEVRKLSELSSSVATSLDTLMQKYQEQGQLEIHVIVKADMQGSCEAIQDSLNSIKSAKVALQIVNSGIGLINANDVQRAASGRAIIVGFHVGCEPGVQSLARHDGVRISTHRIIYELIDHVKQEMLNMLHPEYKEILRGHAEIRAIFNHGKRGMIAGCQMLDGVLRMDSRARVLRQTQVVFDGKFLSLFHFQDEVARVDGSQECGARFVDFAAFAVGDVIECYSLEEKERVL